MSCVLALDAATGPAAACLILPERVIIKNSDDTLPHSRSIVPLLESLLAEAGMDWQQLDILALGTGPGTLTGLRIAASVLAGINAGLKLPMLELSSLAITAAQAQSDVPLWVLEDARAGEVFCGQYRQDEVLTGEACLNWSEVQQWPAGPYVSSGDVSAMIDWPRLPMQLTRAEALAVVVQKKLQQSPDMQGAARWLQPRYLQKSQAERIHG